MTLLYLHVGGLVAMGFDPAGRYLLTVSHSGRGVFDTLTWQRVARDTALAYPEDGCVAGIGPITGQMLAVKELDYETESLEVAGPAGDFSLFYKEGTITVSSTGT